MQLAIVIIILAAAVGYASWRTYKALTSKGDRCYGCPLGNACKKNKRKKNC